METGINFPQIGAKITALDDRKRIVKRRKCALCTRKGVMRFRLDDRGKKKKKFGEPNQDSEQKRSKESNMRQNNIKAAAWIDIRGKTGSDAPTKNPRTITSVRFEVPRGCEVLGMVRNAKEQENNLTRREKIESNDQLLGLDQEKRKCALYFSLVIEVWSVAAWKTTGLDGQYLHPRGAQTPLRLHS